MKTKRTRRLLALFCGLSLSGTAWSQTAPAVRHPDKFGISAPASELPVAPASTVDTAIPLRPIPTRGTTANSDTVVQAVSGPLVDVILGIQFDGVGANGFVPSDSNMAVGPNHVVDIVNVEWAVYDKSGHIFPGFPKTLGSIWSPLHDACAAGGGDPIAQYDRLADRWFLSQIGSFNIPYTLCLAVSTTNDPTGSYNLYEYSFQNFFPDYPHFTVWPTATNPAFMMMTHLFVNDQTFVGTDACAFDRNAMEAGAQSPAMICFTILGDAGYQPADLDGATPPPDGSPGYFVTFETTTLREWKLAPNFANPGASTFTGPIDISVAPFNVPCNGTGGTCVPQEGVFQQLDTLGGVMMYRMAYRNFGDHESMVVNHSVQNGSTIGPRWYEIRDPNGTPTIYQQGTFSPDLTFRWMGSIAMDKVGDMLLGYSASSSKIHPGIAYTGRLPSDPLGTMEGEAQLLIGTGSQTFRICNGGVPCGNRWGDYSAMRIDPADDCTFWYTNQYLKTNGNFNWSTRIGSAAFSNCTKQPDFTISADPTSVSVVKGQTAKSTLTIAGVNGFSAAVSFSVSGQPAFSSLTITPFFVTGSGTAQFTVTTNPFLTPAGTFPITITATSGNIIRTTMVDLTVTK